LGGLVVGRVSSREEEGRIPGSAQGASRDCIINEEDKTMITAWPEHPKILANGLYFLKGSFVYVLRLFSQKGLSRFRDFVLEYAIGDRQTVSFQSGKRQSSKLQRNSCWSK
jgi:hypothetical protein